MHVTDWCSAIFLWFIIGCVYFVCKYIIKFLIGD